MINEKSIGSFYAFTHAILWSLAPVVAVLTVSAVPPLMSLAATNAVLLIFFAGVVYYRRSFNQVMRGSGVRDAVITGLLLALVFSLLFTGLKFTTAGNAGIIGQSEFFFSFLFFNLFRREHVSLKDFLAGLLMVSGAIIVFMPEVIESASINRGDALILLANAIAPVLNFFQRRSRESLSGDVILLIRAAVGFPVVLLFAVFAGQTTSLSALASVFPILLFGGTVVFGISKLCWLEAMRRIPVIVANAYSAIGPLATLAFAFLILQETPTPFQLISLIPLFLGAVLLNTKTMQIRA